MLQVVSFTVNPFLENTYLIINQSKEALIIDPGMCNEKELSEFFRYIELNQIRPYKIINTHAHLDHIFGVTIVKEKYKIPFGIHRDEKTTLDNACDTAKLFGLELQAIPEIDFYIDENKPILFGDAILNILFTPGHSPGSIAFHAPQEDFVISGDVLFQDSIGRTDLPGGNFDQLIQSIKSKLFTLPASTKVYPGHGESTTIEREKLYGYLSKTL